MTRSTVALTVTLVAVVSQISAQGQHQHFQVQQHRGTSQGGQSQQFQASRKEHARDKLLHFVLDNLVTQEAKAAKVGESLKLLQ